MCDCINANGMSKCCRRQTKLHCIHTTRRFPFELRCGVDLLGSRTTPIRCPSRTIKDTHRSDAIGSVGGAVGVALGRTENSFDAHELDGPFVGSTGRPFIVESRDRGGEERYRRKEASLHGGCHHLLRCCQCLSMLFVFGL